MTRMSAGDLLNKIEWEGSIIDAIAYGVTSEQVPQKIASLWLQLEKVIPLDEELYAIVEQLAEEEAGG